jgi:hypothetical protein
VANHFVEAGLIDAPKDLQSLLGALPGALKDE